MSDKEKTPEELAAHGWGCLFIAVVVFGGIGWAIYEIATPDKPLAQRQKELRDFTANREMEELTRKRNDIIYDELLREQVRRGTVP